MNAFWTKRRFGLCAGTLTIIVALIVLWTPLQIQYHRWFVHDSRIPHHESPRRFRDYLSPRTIIWMMRGRPTAERIIEFGREHEEALIRLGYFDRRSYHRTIMNPREFVSTVHAGPLKDRLCFFRFEVDGSLEVVAQRDDFARIEEIIDSHGEQK